MSLKQYTSLVRLGDLIFFRALITQTILLGVLGLCVLLGKLYFDKNAKDQIVTNTFKKWESEITEAIYIQQIVSKEEMPKIDNLHSFQNELKSYGVLAKVIINPCGKHDAEIPLYIGKQKLNSCVYIVQDYSYVFKIGIIGFFLVVASVGVSLLVWNRAKKIMNTRFYDPLIMTITDEVNKFQMSESERVKNEAVAMMTTQVAHDIRSPLEVLKGLKDEMTHFPDSTKNRIQLSINRIEEITFNLLNTYKEASKINPVFKNEDLLSILVGTITEKNIEFRKYEKIEIQNNFDFSCFGLFSNINRNSLKNILSNIINNSVESMNLSQGIVKISLSADKSTCSIKIADTGSGIPDELRRSIFDKGFTTKYHGNGLGLYNAKQDIESAGGFILCDSELGKGTSFTITLPRSKAPTFFVGSIDTYKYDKIIVLDDDPSFHEVWNKRLDGLESKIEHIHSVEEMLTKYVSLDSKTLLLSDFELMDNNNDGIDTILKLNHSAHSILVTARSEEQAIQDRCIKAGIKLLPKSLINYVVVKKENLEDMVVDLSVPVILIDDDRLVQINWANYCKKKGLTFHGYKSIDEFLNVSVAFDKSSRIYIDSNLGNGIKGEVESERIFRLGFLNLYLATGYETGSIEKPVWIKEIYSKRPDDIG